MMMTSLASLTDDCTIDTYCGGIYALIHVYFMCRLGVQIIQICVETRSNNGGMITLKEVLDYVRSKKRGYYDNCRLRHSYASSVHVVSTIYQGKAPALSRCQRKT